MPQRPPLGFRVASAPDENPSPCRKCDKNSKFGSHPGRSPGPRELPELLRRFPFPRSPRAPAPARRAPPPGPPQVPAGGRLPPREQRPRDRSARLGSVRPVPAQFGSARLASLHFGSSRLGSRRRSSATGKSRGPSKGAPPAPSGLLPLEGGGEGAGGAPRLMSAPGPTNSSCPPRSAGREAGGARRVSAQGCSVPRGVV